ncbi:hypothetical protein J3L11_18820 [Shewanella sp. 4t3-1-2LB]|uniref:hypothetical protein n=1 Tax=Shewanella sp. 4t3-1-2LB TaxID=2817682 RepID=UPI001A998F55|nr:hypothetical protein [Shewanella sp. 4t3-1-2LB]MBO1273683.1 hypothetical protein [Shewanella sp. 4t3-1-2LB]
MDFIAEVTGMSYSSFSELDLSVYYITLSNTSGTATIKDNIVTISLYDDDGYAIVSSDFSVYKYSTNKYKLSDPDGVKNWASSYIDTAADLKINYDIDTTSTSGTVTHAVSKSDGTVVEASSFSYSKSSRPDEPYPKSER